MKKIERKASESGEPRNPKVKTQDKGMKAMNNIGKALGNMMKDKGKKVKTKVKSKMKKMYG